MRKKGAMYAYGDALSSKRHSRVRHTLGGFDAVPEPPGGGTGAPRVGVVVATEEVLPWISAGVRAGRGPETRPGARRRTRVVDPRGHGAAVSGECAPNTAERTGT